MSAVVAVTDACTVVFIACEGDGNAGVWSVGDVSACMSSTCGSGALSSTGDVL